MAKINDTTTFPNTTPALDDFVIGTDVSDTGNSADGEVVTFTFDAITKLGGFKGVQVFTSSGTWTRPTGVNNVLIFVTGGGGGASSGGSFSGGSGGTAMKRLDVTGISSSTITVGTGGLTTGGSGGSSSWADGTNTITGGGGSLGNVGTASGGDVNMSGTSSYLGGSPSFWGTNLGGGGAPGAGGSSGVVVVLEFS